LTIQFFQLVAKEDNRILGWCGYHSWAKQHRRAEVFYMLKSDDDKRKGLMSEALEKVLEYGKTEMNLRRIEAFVATDNPASYRLLEKFGFQKEAELKFRYQFGDEVDCDFMYSLIFLPRQLNNTTIVLDSQKKVYERKYELIVLFLFQHAIWSQE